MKAKIKFMENFSIQKELPNSDSFGDDIYVEENSLVLSTTCGETRFEKWEEKEAGFLIPAQIAKYNGAIAALNACYGVYFPECEVFDIETSLYPWKLNNLNEYGVASILSEYWTVKEMTKEVFRNPEYVKAILKTINSLKNDDRAAQALYDLNDNSIIIKHKIPLLLFPGINPRDLVKALCLVEKNRIKNYDDDFLYHCIVAPILKYFHENSDSNEELESLHCHSGSEYISYLIKDVQKEISEDIFENLMYKICSLYEY